MTSSASAPPDPNPAGDIPPDDIPRVAPTRRLSSRALLAAFGMMIAVGLSVYALFPESIGGPPLPVRVSLDRAPLPTTGGKVAVLTDVVTVTSELDQPIRHLTIILNGHYEITQASPLQPGGSLTLPQSIFTDKRSNRRFEPETQRVTEVLVRGQLPSKSRGVSKFTFDDSGAQ
ncbi:hypothetical protein Mal15_47730 [Stieleria maiorica]|uniref:Uncharacterized protein n=1 Tax=Stieleria maiorica TaxID=2795974 RepID=A0A5B9ML02_9BACT|nr:hypothetical protein [Stieleria maiorica]QEG00701.1 hypothetical protein Mal15_47730 [Stieleria maiorica]